MTPEQHFNELIVGFFKQFAQQASVVEAQAARIAELEAKLPKEKIDVPKTKVARARRPAARPNGAGEGAVGSTI